jgi:hypothetical protein
MRTGLVELKKGENQRSKRSRITPRRSEFASTIVEVVVATVIIAVAGAGIISSVNYGLFVMQLARENARASQIMLEKLESVRLYNWSEVTSNGYVPTAFTDYYDPQGSSNQMGTVYSGSLAVSNVAFSGTSPSYSTNLRQFTVTVQWCTGGRINHTRTLSTYVAKDGLQNYVY